MHPQRQSLLNRFDAVWPSNSAFPSIAPWMGVVGRSAARRIVLTAPLSSLGQHTNTQATSEADGAAIGLALLGACTAIGVTTGILHTPGEMDGVPVVQGSNADGSQDGTCDNTDNTDSGTSDNTDNGNDNNGNDNNSGNNGNNNGSNNNNGNNNSGNGEGYCDP